MARDFELPRLPSELDYNYLEHLLKSSFRYPRNKIGSLLKSGKLIRVKKGIYVRADGGYSLPTLANMIYGPSYVSQDYALSLYGLIPERVEAVTSMTIQRSKEFRTPVGTFVYSPLPARLYHFGVQHVELTPTQTYLVASREKALVDTLWRRVDIESDRTLEEYLVEDRRMDLDGMREFSVGRMTELAKQFKDPTIDALAQIVRRRKDKA